MANRDVFISYKAEEIEAASWVKSVLESNGISCWMAPSCIPGGSSYAVEIPQAIRQAKVFVLILSSKAQDSQWISREVDLAINEGKIVLPFMLENCALKDDFNFYLTNVQRYAAYENKAAAIEKMLKEIKALVGSHAPEQAPEQTPEQAPEEISVATPEAKQEPAPVAVKAKYDTLSLLSLIFGVLALVIMLGMSILPSAAAIVLSILGVKSLKANRAAGKGMAVSGQVLGLVSMLLGLSIWFGWVGFAIACVIDLVSLFVFVRFYRDIKKP